MYKLNFYPITLRDLASGYFAVPAGKSPVVLTFDDSSDKQFRYLPDGQVDPNSAWGIMQTFHAEHPDWPVVTTFFPLIEVDVPSRILWGQPEFVEKKLKAIIAAGGEIGSHTITHRRLDRSTNAQNQWEFAHSSDILSRYIGNNYSITSMAVPLGQYPKDERFIQTGTADGIAYHFNAVVEVAGGPSLSPFDRRFNTYHIRRVEAMEHELLAFFRETTGRPDLRFVSDGDPATITVPTEATLPIELRGRLTTELPSGLQIRRYDRVVP
ncbi:MAG: hypothetical protein NVS2B7_29740 [Herpetosiphon sp.]